MPLAAWLLTFPLRTRLEQADTDRIPIPYDLLLPSTALTILGFAGMVAFVVDARRNRRLDDRRKRNWTLALIFLNLVSLPTCWWRYIRPQ